MVILASIQSSLSVQLFFSFTVLFFFNNFLGKLKNNAELFLILLIMFCTKSSHCQTLLFKNVKAKSTLGDGIFVH